MVSLAPLLVYLYIYRPTNPPTQQLNPPAHPLTLPPTYLPYLYPPCRSDFKMSFRGKPVPGPPLSTHLAGITQLGLGTSGHAGKFSLSLASLYATTKGDACAATASP